MLNYDLARSEAEKRHDPRPRGLLRRLVIQTNHVLALDLSATRDLDHDYVERCIDVSVRQITGQVKVIRHMKVVPHDLLIIVLGKRPEGGLGEGVSSVSTV